MSEKEIIFSAKEITKNFSGTKALKGVELDVHAGEIVGLVGENGAGKSTLLKIIIGAQPQSSGTMTLRGEPYAPKTPMDAKHHGVGMVYQEQSLIVNLNVAQNIFFGAENTFRQAGFINWNKMNKAASEVLANIDITDINPKKKVSDLNFATRQMVEIAKVMHVTKQSGQDHCLILLDEPTSFLDLPNRYELCTLLRRLAHDHRKCILFSTHELDIALSLCDSIALIDPPVLRYLPTPDMACSGYIERLFSNSFVTFDTESGTIKVLR